MKSYGVCRRFAVQAASSCVQTPCAQTAVWSCMCIFASRLDTMQTIRRGAFHQDAPGCTRMQFTRTQTSTISHRREHAHAPARLRERTHAQGHINAPRTRSCTRARACANTRMRTREETGTTYQTVCGDSMCLPGRARQLSVPGVIESYLVDSNLN